MQPGCQRLILKGAFMKCFLLCQCQLVFDVENHECLRTFILVLKPLMDKVKERRPRGWPCPVSIIIEPEACSASYALPPPQLSQLQPYPGLFLVSKPLWCPRMFLKGLFRGGPICKNARAASAGTSYHFNRLGDMSKT